MLQRQLITNTCLITITARAIFNPAASWLQCFIRKQPLHHPVNLLPLFSSPPQTVYVETIILFGVRHLLGKCMIQSRSEKRKLLPMVMWSQTYNLVFYFERCTAIYLFSFKSKSQNFKINHFPVIGLDFPEFPLDVSAKCVILDQYKIRHQCLGIKYHTAVLTFYEMKLSCKTCVDLGEDCF